MEEKMKNSEYLEIMMEVVRPYFNGVPVKDHAVLVGALVETMARSLYILNQKIDLLTLALTTENPSTRKDLN